MEANKDRDNALKQVLGKRQIGSLPSNFTFHMMEQIRVEAAKQEKRKRRNLFFSLLAALFVILGSFVFCLFFYMDFKLSDFSLHLQLSSDSSSLLGFYAYIAVLALCLLGIDYWIRKRKINI
ncbi:hypothetical protein [Bacteroides sp.]